MSNVKTPLRLLPPINRSPNVQRSKWYAIYTRSRFEKKIYRALTKSGFNAFLPLIREKRAWSDRIKTIEVPLLPSYVFVNITQPQLPMIYGYPGFVRFVSFDGKASVIKEEEIHLLEKIATGDFQPRPATSCGIGDTVRIVRGPLKGWEGKVERKSRRARVVFQFECIRQFVSVEVAASDVERI